MIEHKQIFIKKISHYLPPNKIANEVLISAESLKMKASWVESRLGIKERRWASADQSTSDLAKEALQKINEGEGALYLSTISPDYFTPSTSSEIKRKMGWPGVLPAIDLAAACAGFIFSLESAALYLHATHHSPVYALAAELRSRFLNKKDRRTVFLFGDAAVACSLCEAKENSLAQLLWTHCSTQSLGEPEILIPSGAAKNELSFEGLESGENKIKMVDGVAITNVIEERLVDSVKNCLALRNETINDYALFAFHQGNGQLIRNVLSQLGANETQTHINFGEYGNSSSASVGVVLSEMFEKNQIQIGQKILLVAMGAGYHLGVASLIRI